MTRRSEAFSTGSPTEYPLPAGGAVAALHVAQAASLIAMVARYSDGDKYAEHRASLERILKEADDLRFAALDLAEQDAAAFDAVAAAYRLPRATEQDNRARSAVIADAVRLAAQPPAGVVAASDHVLLLAEELLPIGNRNVITDVAAAADAARAAATTAGMNVEVSDASVAARSGISH